MADMKKYRDEAASLMGQYLLKGYKMLATHCLSCGTVLLQKKGEKELCVLCQEILPKMQEIQQQSSRDPIASEVAVEDYPPAVSQGVENVSGDKLTKEELSQQLKLTRATVFGQIVSATNELEREQAVVTRTQLCSLINIAMITLKTLSDEGSIRP